MADRTRLWALAIIGTLANLLLGAAAFVSSHDRDFSALAAWAVLGLLLLQPLGVVRRLLRISERAPAALSERDRYSLLVSSLTTTTLVLGFLFRALTR